MEPRPQRDQDYLETESPRWYNHAFRSLSWIYNTGMSLVDYLPSPYGSLNVDRSFRCATVVFNLTLLQWDLAATRRS